jgi:signal transduction histidine kinase
VGELTVSRAGPRSPEYGWLLPAALREDPDGAPAPRSTRDWVIDTLCFLVGLGWVLLTTADLLDDGHTMVAQWGFSPPWMVWLDLVVGTGLAIALWWRRRWPVVLAAVTLLTWFFSVTTAFSGLILLFTVAVHRRFAVMAAVAAASVVPTLVFTALRPERGSSYWETVTWGIVLMLIVLLWGMVLRSRRQLVVSLRERAERAESEQQLRVAQARTMERTRIAREMHDVLAHRISLLSLHAGALEIHPDAAPAEVAGAAGVIRASAHQALQDLREVIGVLREPAGDDAPERPQPTLR